MSLTILGSTSYHITHNSNSNDNDEIVSSTPLSSPILTISNSIFPSSPPTLSPLLITYNRHEVQLINPNVPITFPLFDDYLLAHPTSSIITVVTKPNVNLDALCVVLISSNGDVVIPLSSDSTTPLSRVVATIPSKLLSFDPVASAMFIPGVDQISSSTLLVVHESGDLYFCQIIFPSQTYTLSSISEEYEGMGDELCRRIDGIDGIDGVDEDEEEEEEEEEYDSSSDVEIEPDHHDRIYNLARIRMLKASRKLLRDTYNIDGVAAEGQSNGFISAAYDSRAESASAWPILYQGPIVHGSSR
mgnify:FL=1